MTNIVIRKQDKTPNILEIPVFKSESVPSEHTPALIYVNDTLTELLELLADLGLEICIFERTHEDDVLVICFQCPSKDITTVHHFDCPSELLELLPTEVTALAEQIAPLVINQDGIPTVQ